MSVVSILGAAYVDEQHLTGTITATRLTPPAAARTALIVVASGTIRINWDPNNLVTSGGSHDGCLFTAGCMLEENELGLVSIMSTASAAVDIVYFN